MRKNNINNIDPIKVAHRMRFVIGLLAFILPITLTVLSEMRGLSIQPSISHYYYTDFREILTCSLAAIGLFLICYESKDEVKEYFCFKKIIIKYKIEKRLSVIAGFAAIFIAFFPTTPIGFKESNSDIIINKYYDVLEISDLAKYEKDINQYTLTKEPSIKVGNIHLGSASFLFTIIGLLSIFVFRHKESNYNKIYLTTGVVIFISIIFMLIAPSILNKDSWLFNHSVFVGEIFLLFSFGISWLFRGIEEDKS